MVVFGFFSSLYLMNPSILLFSSFTLPGYIFYKQAGIFPFNDNSDTLHNQMHSYLEPAALPPLHIPHIIIL